MRLAHHALQAHSRDNGYDPQAWISQAITLGGLLALEHGDDPDRLLELQHEAAVHLADAIVALVSDRLAFADHLTQAQGVWLACYRCARR